LFDQCPLHKRVSKLKYILYEALYWFHDEIKQFQILKILYNVAFLRLSKSSLQEDFLMFLMKLSIIKARENNKTIIFLQDGINLVEKCKFLYNELGEENFNYIILITTSSDPKVSSLARKDDHGFRTVTLEEAYEDNLDKKTQRKIVKYILNTSDGKVIDTAIELFSCNMHILSHYKE